MTNTAQRRRAPLPIVRLAAEARPPGPVFAQQRWQSVLFLHWPVPSKALRRFVPKRLTLDTFGGEAWVTAAMLTVTGARLRPFPALPGLSSFHEVDLRTYVHHDGEAPGVWFFGRDATNAVASVLGRLSLRLPFFVARARRRQEGEQHHYESRRLNLVKAEISADWRARGPGLDVPSSSLEHFLHHRFYAYSPSAEGRLWRQQVHHSPWPLYPAELLELKQTLDGAHELPALSDEPLAHWSPGVDVDFFPPRLV